MTLKKDSRSVLVVAAEASSALYAKRLIQHWKDSGVELDCFGIGDQKMVDLGFDAIGRAEDLAVVGIQEVIAHWSEIKSVFDGILSAVEKRKPQFALLLDYPGFNLRLAKRLKQRGVKVVYYISPQIWAWRQGRVKHMKKYVDLVLTLFPFENQFYRDHGVPVEFVGHPLLDEIADMDLGEQSRHDLRGRYGIDARDFVLGLMPGSRKSEIGHHLQTQLEVAHELYKTNSHLKAVLLVAPGLDLQLIRDRLEDLSFPVKMIQDEPFQMIHLTDAILCASGTATIMVGLLAKPMVVMYKMNAFTAFLARLLVKKTRFFAMVNLILGREVVPERFQGEANVKELAKQLQRYVSDDLLRERVSSELSNLKAQLGDKGATRRVASSLESFIH